VDHRARPANQMRLSADPRVMTIFTDELFARAKALKAQDLPMSVVAFRLGVNERSLITMANRKGVKLGRAYRKRDDGTDADETAKPYTMRLKRDPLLERLQAGLR
jgi:hypothetical protein